MNGIKRIASVFAVLLAVSSVSPAVSAESTAIDFENGGFSGFASMKTDDGGDESLLYVVEFNGSRQLKIDVTDPTKPAKLCLDVSKLLSKENMAKVQSVEMEVTVENKDGSSPIGTASGAVATHGGKWGQTSWQFTEFNSYMSETITVRRKFSSAKESFSEDCESPLVLLFRRSSDRDYNMYVDNIRFLDKDKAPIELLDIPGEDLFVPARPESAPGKDKTGTTLTIISGSSPESIVKIEIPAEGEIPSGDNGEKDVPTGNTPAKAYGAAAAAALAAMAASRKKRRSPVNL